MILSSVPIFSIAKTGIKTENIITQYNRNDPITIRVGVVKSAFLNMNCSVGKSRFAGELDNYSWTIGSQEYIIQLDQISRREDSLIYFSDLLNYSKIKNNYDVIIISGIQDELILGGLPFTRNNLRMTRIKVNLAKFVEEGGGFIGHCGGSTVPIRSAYTTPRTLSEEILYQGFFSDTDVRVYCHTGLPILSEHLYLERIRNPQQWFSYTPHPEYMGYLGYLYYNFQDNCGIPMNLDIRDSNHPIFRGYHEKTFLARWGAGPSYITPIGNLNVTNLADYPYDEDPYINESTRINYWTYTEPLPMIESLIATIVGFRFLPKLSEKIIQNNKKWDSIWQLYDWDPTDIPIITDHANHSALVTFNNPEGDENGGRILLSGCHPELCIWAREGNYIDIAQDNDSNTLYDGLIRWMNDSGTPDDPNDDRRLNENDYIENPLCWFVRREAVWAFGKIPDDHYPPIYGRSEVVDIHPTLQGKSNFTIDCSVGRENGEVWETMNLSLLYRYNGSNSGNTWTDWTYYDSINSIPWSFEFNATKAYGPGKYEFYSILNSTSSGDLQRYNCDLPPPEADTFCVVEGNILADFTFKPGTAYQNYDVYFYDNSETKSGTHITEYLWDFGDGNISTETNPTNIYSLIGTYDVTLTVTNNEFESDTITKSIQVINVPKHADLE